MPGSIRGLSGASPGALGAFLALCGLRTLTLRLDRGQANAAEVARRLDQHPTGDRLCDALHVIVHATSLGSVETTIERRSKLPGQEHVPRGLLRLSVGCEHIDDLWHDLDSALGLASRSANPA